MAQDGHDTDPGGPVRPLGEGVDPSLRNLRIPIPRYPYFIHPSWQNWYRTTVNPLVWQLVADLSFPLPTTVAAEAAQALFDDGLLLDTYNWALSHFWSADLVLEERIKFRPDALLDIRIIHELFALLTSGRRADHAQAVRCLQGVAMRYDGSPPSITATRYGREATSSSPSAKREGRERLAKILDAQLAVWSAAQTHGAKGTTRAGIVTHCRSQLRSIGTTRALPSDSRIRQHLDVQSDYMTLLSKSARLLKAACELYGPDAGSVANIEIRSLRDALAWLHSDS